MKALDLRFLGAASTSVLGYFVHTWFTKYLAVIFDSLRRYFDMGLLTDVAEPTEAGRYRMLFDFGAIHLERFVYLNGIYFYVLAAHKGANYQLMNRFDGKFVLYLRGYDFEGSITDGSGAAVGFSTSHTANFTWRLGDLLVPDKHGVQVFKVLSPKDVYWETVDAQRYFSTNYADLMGLAQYPIRSVYLNALRWQEGVTALLDRMDHYVVYVSSITESLLWELGQLDRDDRRGRVTVVFDEEAIANKEVQLGLRDRMRREFGDRMIWAPSGSSPEQQAADLRATLASKFLVTTPEEFERDIEVHRRRIGESSAPLGPGRRETWLDFEFHPALDEAGLRQIREFSAQMQAHIDEWTGARGIDCLPAFLNLVQLRIYCTLLMGEHDRAGVALACYAAVMRSAHEYYSAPKVKVGALSRRRRKAHLSMLTEHLDQAAGIAFSMLSIGRSHEFGDYRDDARATYDAAFERTKAAVDRFFVTAVKLNG